jgi:hypothetical protein
MLLLILVIIGTLTKGTTSSYRLCSCCYDPAIYRGVELNGTMCVHAKPLPLGIKGAGKYAVSNEEDLKTVEAYLRDYVYYPEDLPRIIGLNETLAWLMDNKVVVMKKTLSSSSSDLYYTRDYDTFIEDNDKYTHTPCCKK